MEKLSSQILYVIIVNWFIAGVYSPVTLTVLNQCEFTVWPAIASASGTFSTTGFALQTGESKIINAPWSWQGRLWGRTHCGNVSGGNFSCITGDCGTGKLECDNMNSLTPVTLVEFNLDGPQGMDFYDLSLVDGFNLPIVVVPEGDSRGNCTAVRCVVDLNERCPSELRTSAGGNASLARMRARRSGGTATAVWESTADPINASPINTRWCSRTRAQMRTAPPMMMRLAPFHVKGPTTL
ncbi:PR5-like receptor kinase [Sesamum angolense]|uniref:PR5-like receptor kinase n=1 Tax=Sesamum angolense TaxID=2727404 RepID=A0AAE2BKW6_9LAMI|nr:PR5-like receptor kinase [Sesamum angolense]